MILKIFILIILIYLIKCDLIKFNKTYNNNKNKWKSQIVLNEDDYEDDLQIEAESFNFTTNFNENLTEFQHFQHKSKYKKEPKVLPSFIKDLDKNKIQSNTKNIENDSGNNFIYEKNIIITPSIPEKYLEKSQNEEEEEDEISLKNNKNSLNKKKTFVQMRKSIQSMRSKNEKLDKILSKNRINVNENVQYYSGSMDNYPRKVRHRGRRAVTAKKDRIWDHGIIPYEIDKIFSASHKALFKQAMRHWENFTCIKFVERDAKIHINYIYFTVRNCGCCSFVGKRGNGRQAISIGRNCEKFGIVVHELGHVVGFWHEHTRTDRDKHIVINRSNILKGQEYNFNVLSPDDVDSLGLPYDYSSIMHYARNTFSKSVYLDTIEPIFATGMRRPEIGQRLHLSNGDISQANLLYKCSKCGRTFQQNSGKIESPNFSKDLMVSNHEHCEWRITATHGERIILKIEELHILKLSEDCDGDYLEIRDGYWHKSPLIKRLCGDFIDSENIITTDSSRMLLTYVNRNLMAGYKGFKAKFEVMCGGEIFVNDTFRIDSPNYPLEYVSDKECIWKISVPENYEAALKFQSFEIENHDNCLYDYVEIRDGDTSDSELIGVFCGYKLPPSIKTTTNKMYVKFISDNSVQKMGFSALLMKEIDECKQGNHGCQHECINTLGGYECVCFAGFELQSNGKSCEDACGGVIHIDASIPLTTKLNSPSYPDVYPILKDCVWEIHAPEKFNVFINFTKFDLEGAKHQVTECNYDYVSIYSKLINSRLKRIGTYCGNEIPPFVNSEQNILRIEFHSDKSIQHTGFVANILTDIDECATNNGDCQHYCQNTFGSYKCSCRNGYTLDENNHNCIETKCKFEITSPYGIIHSPNYPEDYPRKTFCYWHFTTIPGHRIQLTFHDFEVETHQECIYDYVGIYDGNSENSSTLGIYCGGKEPYTPVLASTNEMYLVLRTDAGLQKKGFMAIHSTECGGYLQATNQTKHFYSHARYGNRPYKKDMYCVWRIQSDPDSSVKLNFMSFSIEYSEKCDYDYVQVTEEFNSKRSFHGKFCGNDKPVNIISYSDTLIVKFKSDESTALKGFAASYVAVEPPEIESEFNTDYDSTTPFPGYHKSVYYDDYDENE